MKTYLAAVVLGGVVLGLAGCVLEGQYGGPAVVARPGVVVEMPGIVIDEPGVFVEPGIVFREPVVVWDFDARREIAIDRRDWDHWRADRDGRRIDTRGHHFELRRPAKFHKAAEEKRQK